jgi:hypothetical protein
MRRPGDQIHQGRGPAGAARQIDEGKGGPGRAGQSIARADFLDIGQRFPVGGQQDVIAIVDAAVELGVEVGAAAPARVGRGFIERDGLALAGQAHRAGQAGDAGANDMDSGHALENTMPERDPQLL